MRPGGDPWPFAYPVTGTRESWPALTVPVSLSWIPGGSWGSLSTLAAMRTLARRAASHPDTVALLRSILSDRWPADLWERAVMVRDWMASHVVFLSDPEAVSLAAGGSVRVDDYVRDPVGEQYPQLRRSGVIRGDCDDAASLGATLGRAAGLPARLRVVSFDPSEPRPYTHVFAELLTPRGWLDLDITRRNGSPRVTRTEAVNV